VNLTCAGTDERLPPEVEAAAYRILQEALTNVAKHAGATSCDVSLERRDDRLVVIVDDNGTGFNPAAADRSAAPHGLGLIGIRERAAQLQGTLRLESTPSKGTRLTVELPARPRVDPETPVAGSDANVPATVRKLA
jgi:signal transduction histidine kinase